MNISNAASRTEAAADAEAVAVFNERLLTIKRVALIFGVKVTTVREWIARGELLAIKIGKEYRVSETALREYKQAKEEQQRQELLDRRRRQELESRLAKHRQNEPELKWALTNCIACGQEPVLSTRHRRLDGDVFCQPCGELARGKDWLLPKDGWERTVALRVEELNSQAHENLDMWDVIEKQSAIGEGRWVKPYQFYKCPLCGKPSEVTREEVKDLQFYPECDHQSPFRIDPRYHAEVARDRLDYHKRVLGGEPTAASVVIDLCWHPRVVADLARLEAGLRNHEAGADDGEEWRVCLCASCGRRQAVARAEDRLVGDTTCRMCAREKRAASLFGRLEVICEVLNRTKGETVRLLHCKGDCEAACELVDIDEEERGLMTLLTVCSRTPPDQRETQAYEYSELLCSPRDRIKRRLSWAWEVWFPDLPF